LQVWWSGKPRWMRRALRKHGVSPRTLGKACMRELTSHVSGLADITQQEYASTEEWAFSRMADPVASEVARYKRGNMRNDSPSSVVDILKRHGVVR
jgi:hypothetical protein